MKRYSMSVNSAFDTGPQVDAEEDTHGEYVRFDDLPGWVRDEAARLAFNEWLSQREEDIALDIEDLGMLKPVFRSIFGRSAQREAGT